MRSDGSTSRGRRARMVAVTAVVAVAWTAVAPAGAAVEPSARSWAGAAPAGKRVLLFGGLTGGFALGETTEDDTWSWDGANWSEVATSTAPPSRQGAAMAYDAATNTVVLFGGDTGCCRRLNDTWTWDVVARTWTQRVAPSAPTPRSGATMAYDPATRKLVLFGGLGPPTNTLGDSPVPLNDTWTWDGATATWALQTSPASPPARSEAAMAAAGSQLVLFGGEGLEGTLSDTWIWDGQTKTWSDRTSAVGPSARRGAAAAYHPPTSTVVLFGGATSDGQTLVDTWTWNGTKWKQRTPLNNPPQRARAVMAHHGPSGTTMLFGGESRQTPLGDTWAWNGTNWKRR